MRRAWIVLVLLAGSTGVARAQLAPCDEFVSWRPSDGCPTSAQRCLSIDAMSEEDIALIGVSLPRCDWTDVQLRITRSNTIVNCGNQTLRGAQRTDGTAGIHVTSVEPLELLRNPVSCVAAPTASPMCEGVDPFRPRFAPELGLHDVTIMNCNVEGYKHGIVIGHDGDRDGAGDMIEREYLAWFEHPAEATCRVEQVEDCIRSVSAHRITITDVSTHGSADVGIYVGAWSHGVEIVGSTISGTGKGPGVYLDSGSRDNQIIGNTITGNGREAVAIDASADNLIQGNHIEGNGTRDGGDDERFRVGVAIYKNFWENRWGKEHGPRVQRSERNVIDDNDIIDHIAGVRVAMRQDWNRRHAPGSDSAWGDPIYYFDPTLVDAYYYRERAADNIVRQNTFDRNRYGVVVRDDHNQILGNTFTRSGRSDVIVGSEVRQWVREPVFDVTVAGNVLSYENGTHPEGFVAVHVKHCSLETSIWLNAGGPIVTDSCGLTRSRVQAITATSSGHTLAFGRRMAHLHASQAWLVGDFDGSGDDDVVTAYWATDGRLRLWQHRTAGASFDYQSSFQTMEWSSSIPEDGQWLAGNFNGGGGDDLAYIYRAGSATGICLFTPYGDGFNRVWTLSSLTGCTTLSTQPYATSHRWLASDFNADGRDDLLRVYPSGTTAYVQGHRSVSSMFGGWFQTSPSFTTYYGAWRDEDIYLGGDFDGDGAGDVARIWRGADDLAQIWAYYLGATGPVGSRNQGFSSAPGAGEAAGFVVGRRWLASDFDGDGRKDIVLVYSRSGDARVWRHRSTGRAWSFAGIQTIEIFVSTQRWLSGRFDAGASDDLLRVSGHVWQ
ncbi:MAG: right-handed parallel beta-helix repeat-containing protein [Deltaproteobacteria bacterium]|nr:right-handed parallel beta-helix repeat-containing protein [Kofleriaceae bacterium]